MQEEWRDIKGFEGLYQVSNTGKVLSLNYANRGYSRELTPKKNNHGYLWVQLRNNGIIKNEQIHRLVARTFLNNPNSYPIVNHKDENPLNNNVSNLEWCTHQYNCLYSMKLHERRWKDKKPRKLFDRVLQRNAQNNELIAIYENITTVVREKGYHNTSIKECCLGKRKTAYGYKWEFEKPILNTPERTGSSNANSERTEDKKMQTN